MRQNSAMRSLMLATGNDSGVLGLPEELDEVLRGGWYTADCGALLLVTTGGHARSWPCERQAVAQREYEVNDIRVPSLDLQEGRDQFIGAVARRAYSFARAALKLAAGNQVSESLVAVISVGIGDDCLSHGATVKFFTMRGAYPDWFDDLEMFKSEAMMFLQMGDIESTVD